jgi:alpha-1,3-rhamnosyl/mannosyltransferase
MNIGFGTTFLENGLNKGHMDGIGIYAKNLWIELESTNKEAVTFGKTKTSSKATELLGDIKHLPLSYPIQSTLSLISGKPFLGLSEIEQQIDLFFAPDHHIPKMDNTPVVATIMDAYPLIYPKLVSQRLRRFKNLAFKKASRWADHIVTISEHSKSDITHHFGIEKDKISVIPLGVNEIFFRSVSEEEKLSVLRKFNLDRGYFIFVGTIQPRKNLLRLIEAHQMLPSKLRQKHPLVIVGKYGWGDSNLKQKLKSLKNKDMIYHLDNVLDGDLYALLQSAIAMVYPSLYEGFGLPILEGFASNIPVITSSTTSIPEVASDGACYVNPLDSSDIAAKMQLVAQDISLQEELVSKGKKRVQEYSWSRCAKEHLDLFLKIIK